MHINIKVPGNIKASIHFGRVETKKSVQQQKQFNKRCISIASIKNQIAFASSDQGMQYYKRLLER